MKNTVIYKGMECRLEKVRLYLKAGAYEHKWREGWQLVAVETGEVVISGQPRHRVSAYEYAKPQFPTRKSLAEHIDFVNSEDKAREARHMRGRPIGSKAEKSRELTKRQRWTAEEWVEVEKASAAVDETPSDFIRAATLQRCRKKTR